MSDKSGFRFMIRPMREIEPFRTVTTTFPDTEQGMADAFEWAMLTTADGYYVAVFRNGVLISSPLRTSLEGT